MSDFVRKPPIKLFPCKGCTKKYTEKNIHLKCTNCNAVYFEECLKEISRCKNTKCTTVLCLSCWGKLQECSICHTFLVKRILKMTMDIEKKMNELELK